MSTITTKQLRENMAKIVSGLQQGESVQLSYRHKIIGVLQPIEAKPVPQRQGSAIAIQHFLNKANFGSIPPKLRQSKRSFKQEVADLRSRDLTSK